MSKKAKKASAQTHKMVAVAPKAARLREVRNLYEAAAAGRRTQHWRSSSLDANAEIEAAASKVRNVARDMVRNNAFAARAKAVITHNTVGAGIVPRVEGVSQRAKKLILSHLETTDIDADGRTNLYGLQSLVMGAVVESGEVLIRRRLRTQADGYALPYQLQVLESDYLDTSRDGPVQNGNLIQNGIEFDAIGRRVAYWIYPNHPGSTHWPVNKGAASTRVDAANILHIYRVDRPGQMRGMSWFAPIVLRLRDFCDFTDAQLVRQKIAACFAAFIKTAEGYEGDVESGQNYPLESFEPGMIERLRPEEDVTFATPPTTQDFASYSMVTLREIAVGLGITYETLTSDLTSVNFSSGRMGFLEFQRNIDAWRWLMLMPQMMDGVAKWTNEALSLATGIRSQAKFTWTPPRREYIDPSSEITASINAIRGGLTTRSEEVRKLGMDPAEIDAENAADNARADELGLIYESDARVMTDSGQLQGQAVPKPAPAPAPAPAAPDPAAQTN
jgi:lambda family phage portal protein